MNPACGIIAGTPDTITAIIQTLIYGRSPIRLLQYVASGVFGRHLFLTVMHLLSMGLSSTI